MDFVPTEEQRMLQDSALTYFTTRAARSGGGSAPTDRQVSVPGDWQGIADLGWLALQLPEDLGGMSGGALEAMILMEAFGRAGALEPFLSSAVLGARALLGFGSIAQRQELLPQLAQGGLRFAAALYEDASGCMPSAIATRAVPCQGGYTLHGEKPCVLDAATAGKIIVAARIESGELGFFLVDDNVHGLEARHFVRLDGGWASQLRLRAVGVRNADRIGRPGQGEKILAELTHAAVAALCAEAVGAMQALHDLTLDYLKMRRQFGRPIGQFQVLQHRQVDMLIALEQARSIVVAACMALAEGLPAAERLLSMAKITVGRAGRCVAHGAVQLHGGMGMSAELPVGGYFKRLAVIDAMFGSADHRLRMLAGLHDNASVADLRQSHEQST